MYNLICIILGFIYLFFGILIFFCKADFIFPVFRRIKKQLGMVKANRLCRNIGFIIAICSVILFMGGFWQAFLDKAFLICMIVWCALCVADIIFIVKSRRYKNDED